MGLAELAQAVELERLPAELLREAGRGALRPEVAAAWVRLARTPGLEMLCRRSRFLRQRLLADPRFLFKALFQVGVGAAGSCAQEARRWRAGGPRAGASAGWAAEAPFFAVDLVVGAALDFALVALLAPVAALGVSAGSPAAAAVAATSSGGGAAAGLRAFCDGLPRGVCERAAAGAPGYTVGQRASSLVLRSAELAVVGSLLGVLGQLAANSALVTRKKLDEGHAEGFSAPNPGAAGASWGGLAVLASLRFQAIVGAERVVEQRLGGAPALSLASTVLLRGGDNLVWEQGLLGGLLGGGRGDGGSQDY